MKFSSSALFAAAAAPAYGVDASSAKDLSTTSARPGGQKRGSLRSIVPPASNDQEAMNLLKVAEDVVAQQELSKEAAEGRSLSPFVGYDIGTFFEICDDYSILNVGSRGRSRF